MLNLVSAYSVTLKEAIVPHKLLKVSPNQVVQVSETESTHSYKIYQVLINS